MQNQALDVVEKLASAGSKGNASEVASSIATGLKHNFSRSGMKVDIDTSTLDELVQRVAGANVKIIDKFAAGDRFAGRYSCTVKGDDVPGGKPGTKAEMTGLVIGRVADGKVVEVWHEQDTVGMMLALGLPVGA